MRFLVETILWFVALVVLAVSLSPGLAAGIFFGAAGLRWFLWGWNRPRPPANPEIARLLRDAAERDRQRQAAGRAASSSRKAS